MPPEIIDLTSSPPPPSRSFEGPKILNFAAANSAEQVQFGNFAMPSWPNPNPNLPYTNQQQATIWPASMHIYDLSQATTSFQPNMHGDQVVTMLEPMPKASALLFPHETRLKDWTPREHELFMMGLIKYGRGHWTKIARHFLSNKTPQQVQSYANSFFRHLPSTHLYSFRKRNNSAYSTTSFMTARSNMSAHGSYNMPFITVNSNEPIKKTIMLFPEKEHNNNFFQVEPLVGEASSSSTNYAYGLFQMQTIGASTSMSTSGNSEEVDLELRLGRCQ